jgi:hypothetical protein
MKDHLCHVQWQSQPSLLSPLFSQICVLSESKEGPLVRPVVYSAELQLQDLLQPDLMQHLCQGRWLMIHKY